MDTKKPFIFNYKKYESKSLTLDQVDSAFEILKSPATSSFQIFVKGFLFLLTLAYIVIRKNLIEEKMLIAKQDYEAGRTNSNADQIDSDDLD